MKENGVVYFVSSDDGKYTKIGMTKNMEQRFRALQTHSPLKLHVVATIPTDNPRELEHELHREYASHRLDGEWFDIPPEMALSIARSYSSNLERFETTTDIMNSISYFRRVLQQMSKAPREKQNPAEFYSHEDVDLFGQSLKKYKARQWTHGQGTVYELARVLNGALFILLQQNAWGNPSVVMQTEAKKLLNYIEVFEMHTMIWSDKEEMISFGLEF